MTVKYTYQNAVVSFCSTPQSSDLDKAGFEALSWVVVSSVGNSGEWSTADNIINYDTVDEAVTQKQKGIRNAGDPVIEVARIAGDAGQQAMRTAANTTDYYAIKRVLSDGTTQYSRGLVTGPERPGGAVEDFILERFTLGLVQILLEDNGS